MKRSFVISGIATMLSSYLYFGLGLLNSYFYFDVSFYHLDTLQLAILPQGAGGMPLLFNNLAISWAALLGIVFAILFAFVIDKYGPFRSSPASGDESIRGKLLRSLMFLWMIVLWISLGMTLYWSWLLLSGSPLLGNGGVDVPLFMLSLASPQFFGLSFFLFFVWHIIRKINTGNIAVAPTIAPSVSQKKWSNVPFIVFTTFFLLVIGIIVWGTTHKEKIPSQLTQYHKVGLLVDRMGTELQLLGDLIRPGEIVAPDERVLEFLLRNKSESLHKYSFSNLSGLYCSKNISAHVEEVSARTGANYYSRGFIFGEGWGFISLQEFKNFLVQNNAYCLEFINAIDNSIPEVRNAIARGEEPATNSTLLWADSIFEDLAVWSKE